jgi:hypothetical protein
VPPFAIVVGKNAFDAVSPAAVTVNAAGAAVVFEPTLVTKPPTGIVSVPVPTVVLVTGTMIVQLLFAGIVPPVAYVTLVAPNAAVTVPVHVPLDAPAIVTPAGSVLNKLLVNVATDAFGSPSVIVNVLVPPATIDAGANA